MKLKVCGMKYRDNINEVAQLLPDYLGFIFYEKSSRFFDRNLPEVPESIKKVGVFVDASVDAIIENIETHHLQAVQLHGQESPKCCQAIREFCHSTSRTVEIIKVFSIKTDFDFSVLKAFEKACDYYLFDTKGKLPGGNGYAFNWDVLQDYPSTKPYFLSGGIGLNEIKSLRAFKNTKASKYCYAIDVNSKFEIEAGLKNTIELEKFKHELQH
ncbi:phosphoribosylanthranilate isomerase [Formosa sp. Hel1_31_208]|uniref:phosphoribosylanthranilate isomerase n=1 Tax=Formosa sp. Hel1_31_208 TaxID=1798225 RepID=UPI00087C74C9|nr:phosphoribosylanthranilate isomerase [Formosa sp. Hel1_31_208]SDS01236.1 phosphoribosylanthranilate isomerase [Formosa sp. Hel1_31_208]